MNERRSRKNLSILSPQKRLIMIGGCLVLILMCFAINTLIKNSDDAISKKKVEIEYIKSDINVEESKATELQKSKNQKTTDEDYEEMAREDLGLIKKDEIVIKPR